MRKMTIAILSTFTLFSCLIRNEMTGPLSRVRLAPLEARSQPYITIMADKGERGLRNGLKYDVPMELYMRYVVIHCDLNDWPLEIELPELRG